MYRTAKDTIDDIIKEYGSIDNHRDVLKRIITLKEKYESQKVVFEYLENSYRSSQKEIEANRIDCMRKVIYEEKADNNLLSDKKCVNLLRQEEFQKEELIKALYENIEDVLYLVYKAVDGDKEWFEDLCTKTNIGWLWKMLTTSSNKSVFVINENKLEYAKVKFLVDNLLMLHKEVYVLNIGNVKKVNNSGVHNLAIAENVDFDFIYKQLKDYMNENLNKNFAVIIGTGEVLSGLSFIKQNRTKIERLDSFLSNKLEHKLSFGWIGDYLYYLESIFDQNIENLLNVQEEFDCSIVIPVRSGANTLKATIQTCLYQDFEGTYEIVVSDNSDTQDTSVYELCRSFNSEKIHYYKTPRILSINKSFEYAMLKTKGKYVIPLGGDDGILPWGLRVVKEVFDSMDDTILQWDRGQYVWKNYGKGLDDSLFMPGGFTKGVYTTSSVPTTEYWARLLLNYDFQYLLPNLYLNAGFKRIFLKEIYHKIGRIWDGQCNDVSMGIINISTKKNIIKLNYPITVAGNSNNSIGKKYTVQQTLLQDVLKNRYGIKSENYIGGEIIDKFNPNILKAVGGFYSCVFNELRKRVIPEEIINLVFDWKKIIKDMYCAMDVEDIYYERDLYQLKAFAAILGQEYIDWFENEIFKQQCNGKETKKVNPDNIKIYKEWAKEDGSFHLDASNFGVIDIFGAIKLCEAANPL